MNPEGVVEHLAQKAGQSLEPDCSLALTSLPNSKSHRLFLWCFQFPRAISSVCETGWIFVFCKKSLDQQRKWSSRCVLGCLCCLNQNGLISFRELWNYSFSFLCFEPKRIFGSWAVPEAGHSSWHCASWPKPFPNHDWEFWLQIGDSLF